MGRSREFVAVFINCGADVNAKNNQGNTPLHLYLLNINIETSKPLAVVEFLLQSGANEDEKDREQLVSLFLAVKNIVREAIGPLRRAGANVNAHIEPALLSMQR